VTAIHIQAPDEFVLELRTRAARTPALPVRPLTAREVSVAVGHAFDESSEVPLDLSGMKRVVVDPQARTARVQPGVTDADLDRATFYWGLVAAELVAAEVVLPDGELVHADAELVSEIRTGRALGIVVDATYRLRSAA